MRRSAAPVLVLALLLPPLAAHRLLAGPALSVVQGSTAVAKGSTFTFPASTPVGVAVSVLFTINNTGNANLTLSNAGSLVSGGAFSEIFTPTTPVAAGGNTVFRVRLQSGTPGTFTGTVSIASNDPVNPTFTFTIQGTVTGPVISVQAGSTQVAKGSTSIFPSTAVGVPVSVLFTISNTGSAPLNLSNASSLVSGGAFSEIFTPTTPVAAGGNTVFRVRLQSATAGTFTGTVTIASDDPVNPTFSFTVQGTVTGPVISVQAGSTQVARGSTFVFPASTPVNVATSVLFTISNTGSAPLNLGNASSLVSGGAFSEIFTPTTPVAAGGNTVFRVRLLSGTAGTFTGTVTIASDDPVNPTFSFTVQGTVTGPTISVQAGSAQVARGSTFVFPASTPVNVATSVLFTISNTGSAPLNLGNASSLVTGGAFSEILAPATPVAVGGNTVFRVRLLSGTAGTFSGTVTIASDDPVNPTFNFTVQGTVTGPAISVQAGSAQVARGSTFVFPATTPAGVATSVLFTISNTGSAPLNIGNVNTLVSGGAFSEIFAPTTPVAAGGGSTVFRVRLLSGTAGTFTGTVTITSDDPVNPTFSFTVSGTVTAAGAIGVQQGTATIANGSTFTFPASTPAGVPASVLFTISNSGAAPLSLSNPAGLVSGGAFSEVFAPTTPVAAGGGTTVFRVRLQSATAGTFTGTVTIASNDPVTPTFSFTVVGTVTAAPVIGVQQGAAAIANGSTYTFPAATLTGVAEPITFTITNSGGAALNLGNPTALVSGAGFSETQNPATPVVAGGTTSFTVQVQASTAGTFTGTVTIASDDPLNGTFTFTVVATVSPSPHLRVVQAWNNATVVPGGVVTFPDTGVATAESLQLLLVNDGPGSLTIANPSALVSGACYAELTPAPAATVAAGQSASVRVRLECATAALAAGTFSVSSNDPVTPTYSFNLSGAVGLTLPPLTVESGDGVFVSHQGTYAFPDTAESKAETRGFTVTNNGTQPFTIANPSALVSEDPAFTEAAAPAGNVIAPGGSQAFRVGLQSAQTGAHYGQVTIASADPTQKPFLFGVTGNVQPPDFTLSVTPASRNLIQGQNVGYQITTASLFGFSSNLTLGEAGLDGSSSATFAPATIAAGGTSQMRIYTSAGTPVGTQTVTITATGGGVTHTLTVTLTVAAAPVTTLTVTLFPTQQTVTPGGGAVYSVAVGGSNLSTTVALTATVPGGITATFDSASLMAGETANLTLATTSALAPGSYPVTVTGTVGAVTASASGTLVVQAAGSPGAPSITGISPNVIVNGRVTTATVIGQNLQGAAISIPTSQALPNQPLQRVFPGATVLSTSADGTSMQVSIDATDSGIMDFYNLAAANGSGQTVTQFRVLPPGPVIDNLSPGDAPAGSVSLLSLVGAHLRNVTVALSPPSAASISNLDTTEDDRTNGLLFVAAGLPVTTVTLTVTDSFGQSYSTTMSLGGAETNAQSVPSRAIATLPGPHGTKTNIYFRPFRPRRLAATRVVRPGLVIEDLSAVPVTPNDDISLSFTFSATFSLFNYHWQTVILQNPLTGVIGSQALQQLAIGQTTYLAAYVLSAYVELDATVYWNIDLSGDFTFPEFCFSFVAGGEIPGQADIPGVYNYSFCGGGSGTGQTTGSTGNVSISADNSCAQVSQQQLEDGTAIAAVTQNMCCNQPISVSGSGTTFLGTYFASDFSLDEADAITTTPDPSACTCPCSLVTQNNQVVILPDGQVTSAATLFNMSTNPCTYNWSLSQTDGNLGLTLATSSGTTPELIGGSGFKLSSSVNFPSGTPATDSGTLQFAATPLGQTSPACSATVVFCAVPGLGDGSGDLSQATEFSQFDQFYSPFLDLADFGATLQPTATDFTGRMLNEASAGSFDNCTAYAPTLPPYHLSGGNTWTAGTYMGHTGSTIPSSGLNLYGADTVGASTRLQDWFPQSWLTNPASDCTRGATQLMQINCPWGPVSYKANNLLMDVRPNLTTVSRDNAHASHLATPQN